MYFGTDRMAMERMSFLADRLTSAAASASENSINILNLVLATSN